LTTKEAVNYSKKAEDPGSDAVLLPPPFYFYLNREELKAYFKEVADSIKISVILYNDPLTKGIDLEAELVRDLA
jgi:dihydrodipicolinate synthase/N-acetylneuraminate lyase